MSQNNPTHTYLVHYRDCNGGNDVRMTRNEVNAFAQHYMSRDGWCFVNQQHKLDLDAFLSMKLQSTDTIQLMPALVGGQDAEKFEIYISGTASEIHRLTPAEIAERARQSEGWLFVNDMLISLYGLVSQELQRDSRLMLMPGLVGGPTRYSVKMGDGTEKRLKSTEISDYIEKGFRLLISGNLGTCAQLNDLNERNMPTLELRSDLIDVVVSPETTLLMRRGEFERIVRQFDGYVLARVDATLLRNGSLDTLCKAPDFVFENLWSNDIQSCTLIANAC